MGNPEQLAREAIDALLEQAGWHVCDAGKTNIHAARVIEAKKEGVTLTGMKPRPTNTPRACRAARTQ